jgi:hypothetical protein
MEAANAKFTVIKESSGNAEIWPAMMPDAKIF